jgi:hypothetical protein
MLRQALIFGLLFFAAKLSFGQYSHREYPDVFPTFGDFKRSGWLVSPAVTYMLPPFEDATQKVFLPGGTIYDVDYNPAGRIGFGLEIGRFHAFHQSKAFSVIEYSGGIKILQGQESFVANLAEESVPNEVSELSGEGSFSYSYATVRIAASNILQFSKYSFLKNSIGVNADYRIGASSSFGDAGLPMETVEPGGFLFQANYSLGYGFRISDQILLIPSLETPILNIYEYDDLKSTLAVFNTRYRPLIFRLTVMSLDRKADRKCPKKAKKRKTVEQLFK